MRIIVGPFLLLLGALAWGPSVVAGATITVDPPEEETGVHLWLEATSPDGRVGQVPLKVLPSMRACGAEADRVASLWLAAFPGREFRGDTLYDPRGGSVRFFCKPTVVAAPSG